MNPFSPVHIRSLSDPSVFRQRRSIALGGVALMGLAGCSSPSGPRLVPLPPISRPEPPPLSQRRSERVILLKALRERLLAHAATNGQVLTNATLGDRVRQLAAPLRVAARAVRAGAIATEWPIDILGGGLRIPEGSLAISQPPSRSTVLQFGEGADVIPLQPVSLVLVLPDPDPFLGSDDLLSALIAHGLAHGLRDHALESDIQKDGLPGFSAIQEREADRDTCEILARAGLDPLLAGRLRSTQTQQAQGHLAPVRPLHQQQSGRPVMQRVANWSNRHPDPPHAQQAIELFAARVEPLRAAAAAVR